MPLESHKRVAVVLLNFGGPNDSFSIKPFLFNLFNDPFIIPLPQPLRFLLARFISAVRYKKASAVYEMIGGRSPILENTAAQAAALEQLLNNHSNRDTTADSSASQTPIQYKTFLAMRYWHPMSPETLQEVRKFRPDQTILLPLYPHYSTTTTLSSVYSWRQGGRHHAPTNSICCYFAEEKFISVHSELIYTELQKAFNSLPQACPIMIIFSAHSLPKRIVDKGDPYQKQVKISADLIQQKVMNMLPNQQMSERLSWVVAYQSKVGRGKWLSPDTASIITDAAARGCAVIIVPISFISDHSETLAELDIQYRDLALQHGCPMYLRVPTPGTHGIFIDLLCDLVHRAVYSGAAPKCTLEDCCALSLTCKKA